MREALHDARARIDFLAKVKTSPLKFAEVIGWKTPLVFEDLFKKLIDAPGFEPGKMINLDSYPRYPRSRSMFLSNFPIAAMSSRGKIMPIEFMRHRADYSGIPIVEVEGPVRLIDFNQIRDAIARDVDSMLFPFIYLYESDDFSREALRARFGIKVDLHVPEIREQASIYLQPKAMKSSYEARLTLPLRGLRVTVKARTIKGINRKLRQFVHKHKPKRRSFTVWAIDDVSPAETRNDDRLDALMFTADYLKGKR